MKFGIMIINVGTSQAQTVQQSQLGGHALAGIISDHSRYQCVALSTVSF